MSQSITCPQCHKKFRLTKQHIGKKLKCPCGKQFRVAAPAGTASPSSPSGSAKAASMESSVDPLADDLSSILDDPLADAGAPLSSRPATAARSTSSKAGGSFELRNNWFAQTGYTFLVLGVLAIVLPHFGLQNRRLAKLGPQAPLVGACLGLAGCAALFISQVHQPVLGAMMSGGGAVVLGMLWLFIGPQQAPEVPPVAQANPRVSKPVERPAPRPVPPRPPKEEREDASEREPQNAERDLFAHRKRVDRDNEERRQPASASPFQEDIPPAPAKQDRDPIEQSSPVAEAEDYRTFDPGRPAGR